MPTLKEVGYDAVFKGWSGIIGPPKMPQDIVDKLATTFKVKLNPELQKQFIATGQHVAFLSSAKAIKQFDEEREVIKKMMDKAGILKGK